MLPLLCRMLDREENRRHARLVRKAHRLAVADLLETAAMKGVAQAAGPGQASSSQEALPHLLADEEALPQVARPVQAPPEAPHVGSVLLRTKTHLRNALSGRLIAGPCFLSVAPHRIDVCPGSYMRCRKPSDFLHVPQLYANIAR